MKSTIFIVTLLLPLFANAVALKPENPATVTLPMDQYLEMRKQVEGEPLTTIEEVTMRGQHGGELNMTVRGRYVGRAEAIPFLTGAGIEPTACQGEALMKREGHALSVLPTNKNFKLDCRLKIKDWNDIAFGIQNALNFSVQISGGEAQITESGEGRNVRLLKLERQIANAPVMNEAPSVVARYQIVVAPEDTTFAYNLYFNNPNREMREMTFNKVNQEVIQKVATSIVYTDKAGQVVFKLPPGESTARLTGRLPEPKFQSPLKNAREYLLVENDPLVSVDLTGGSKRISVPDTGMRPRFSGAKAFLLTENDKLNWTASSIEVFPALTYTIENANYQIYWSPEQNSLTEANFYINNQGISEIPLKIMGEARYVEVNGTPQVLIKNKDGDLVVRVPYGNGQSVMVQYQPTINTSRGLASIGTELPKPSTMMSEVNVSLQTPSNKTLLFASGLGERQWPVTMMQILFALVTFLMMYVFGRESGLRPTYNLGIAALAALFNALGFLSLTWVFIAMAIGLLLHNRGRMHGSWNKLSRFGKIGTGVGAGLVLMWLAFGQPFSNISTLRHVSANFEGAVGSAPMAKSAMARGAFGGGAKMEMMAASPMAAMEVQADSVADMMEAPGQIGQGNANGAANYQGLPAKIRVPAAQTVANFSLTLANPEQTLALNAVALPRAFLQFFAVLGFLILLALIWQERSRIRSYVRL